MKKNIKTIYFIVGLLIFLGEKLLPIFVLSIVGIPLLILPAISFTLAFLSFKGAGEYLKSNCYTVLQLFYRTDT